MAQGKRWRRLDDMGWDMVRDGRGRGEVNQLTIEVCGTSGKTPLFF